ncbi:hypothetical protein ABH900_001662 [Stenotrophomonas sp. AN71]|uniref:hypothetical protein n=1 Tax=Stenotrophomonas sp. AN71 TaxID=3156253 RepID=UPI003D1BCEFA
MDLRTLTAGMARLRRLTRVVAFAVLGLYVLGMLVGQSMKGAPPPLWAWGLPVLFAGVVWFDARRLLARSDAVREVSAFDQAREKLSSLDEAARAAHLLRLKRRMLVGSVSLIASVVTLTLVPGDYPRAVAWIWLWLFVSAFMTFAYCGGFLLARRWLR